MPPKYGKLASWTWSGPLAKAIELFVVPKSMPIAPLFLLEIDDIRDMVEQKTAHVVALPNRNTVRFQVALVLPGNAMGFRADFPPLLWSLPS